MLMPPRLRAPRNPCRPPPRRPGLNQWGGPRHTGPLLPRRASSALVSARAPAPGPMHRGPSTPRRDCPTTKGWGRTGGALGKRIRRQRRRSGPALPCNLHSRLSFLITYSARQGLWTGRRRRVQCPQPHSLPLPSPLPLLHQERAPLRRLGGAQRSRGAIWDRGAIWGSSILLPFNTFRLWPHPWTPLISHRSPWTGWRPLSSSQMRGLRGS
jgi:hypothetical protein